MTLELSVCSANVLHAKAPWRPLADVVGWQEADKPGWWEKARPPYFRPTRQAALAVGISWDPDWRLVNAWCERAHNGRAGVGPHRYVARVTLEKDGHQVAVVNLHATKPGGVIPARRYRTDAWRDHLKLLTREVGELRMAGIPVIVTGDFNRHRDKVYLPGLRHVAPATRTKRGKTVPAIDHILVSEEFQVATANHLRPRGSDHDPVRVRLTLGAPAPKPPEVIVDDRYELTTHDGKTVDRMTKQALEKAERRLGYPLTIVQGSYNAGRVSQSAGTHDGGGVVDLAAWDWERKVRVLREIGFAAWHRTPAQGPWGEHIHAVLIGNDKAAPSALRQVGAYKRGRNGLASNGVDDFWRPKTIKPYVYKPPPPPSRVSIFRKAVEEALAVTLPKIDSVDRPAAYQMLKDIQAALDKGPRA